MTMACSILNDCLHIYTVIVLFTYIHCNLNTDWNSHIFLENIPVGRSIFSTQYDYVIHFTPRFPYSMNEGMRPT